MLWTLLNLAEGICKKEPLTLEEQAVLDRHNELRAKHQNTDPLCYGVSGSEVTYTSQTWTETIAGLKGMKHSTGSYGENIATGGSTVKYTEQLPAYKQSANMWYNEIKDWNFEKSGPTNSSVVTGHFTQVVWRGSKEVNCGYATYDKEWGSRTYKMFMVTCQYFPAGNYNNAYAENVGPLKSDDPKDPEDPVDPKDPEDPEEPKKKSCDKPWVPNSEVTPDVESVKEGQKYYVKCKNFVGEKSGEEHVMVCGAEGNLKPESITCEDHKASGGVKFALSAILVAAVAVIFY